MKRWILWIGLAISIILVFVSFRALKLDEVMRGLQTANLWWLIPGMIAYFISVGLRSWRWSALLNPYKRISFSRLYPIVVIGYMGNNIYPARIGELVRAYVLRQKEGVPIAYSISTVFLERIVDGLVVAAFVLIGLPKVPNLPENMHSFVLIASGLFLVAIVVFVTLALAPKLADQLAYSVLSRILPAKLQPPILHFVQKFVEGAQCLRSPRDLIFIFLTSVIAWGFETLKYWFVMQAFSLNLSFVALMLLNGASNLATIIPSGPGFVGTYDAASIGVLTALGVDRDLAAAYTIVLHAALWLPVTLLGFYFMLREGLHWSDFKQAEKIS